MTSNYIFLIPLNNSFELKVIHLLEKIKIGRQTNARTIPKEGNGYFDSKVLSRQHAEIWGEGDHVFIKDVKSSNGTFLNNDRLSPEGVESPPVELKSGNLLEFGIDIIGDDNKSVIHRKVSSKILIATNDQEYLECQQQISQQPPSSVSIHKCFDKLEQEIKQSRDLSYNLQHLSGDFNQIHSSLRGQLPTNYQPSSSTSANHSNLDVSSIQQQINKFSQQLQSQQKNYEQLLNEHTILRSKLEESATKGDTPELAETEDDNKSITTERPKTPEPTSQGDDEEDLPNYRELVSQNSSLATRLSTLSDELSGMHEIQTKLATKVEGYEERLNTLEESNQSWRMHWENSLQSQHDNQQDELKRLIDEYDKKQQTIFEKEKQKFRRDVSRISIKEKYSDKDPQDKSFQFAGILSIFILGLAAFTVFRGQQN